MHVWPHTTLLGRVMLYYGFFRTEVSKLGPGGLVSCRVQLQTLSNTPETANLSILETFRQVFLGKLEKLCSRAGAIEDFSNRVFYRKCQRLIE